MKVSVCLRTYNQAAFIEQAVLSVLDQRTPFDFELVIGDDASTDGTSSLLESLAQSYPERIRLLLGEANVGSQRNMIETYALCRGEYVAMLDGDDYWTSNEKLRRQAHYLDTNPEVSICGHLWEIELQSDGGPIERVARSKPRRHLDLEDVVRGYWLLQSTVMLRRCALPAIPPWVGEVSQADIIIQYLCALKGNVTCLEDVMTVYRRHRGAMYSQLSSVQKLVSHVDTLEILLEHVEPAYRRLLMRRMAGAYVALADAHEADGAAEKRQTALRRVKELGGPDRRLRRQLQAWFPTQYRWLREIKRAHLVR